LELLPITTNQNIVEQPDPTPSTPQKQKDSEGETFTLDFDL
jgi:hypothetical protein